VNPKYTGPSLAHGVPPRILTLARRQHVGLQDAVQSYQAKIN
jgi:hypothetical protein